ncbi:MAG: exopolysaccharide biosynthesis polyprenyl glycosylphosphotransferase [Chloroflexota bacterium]
MSININRIRLFSLKHYRLQMGALMFASDLTAFGLVWAGLRLAGAFLPSIFPDFGSEEFLVVSLLSMLLIFYSRLYPGSGINPADEIRMVVERTSIGVTIGLFILLVLHLQGSLDFRPYLLVWAAIPAAVLSVRWTVRIQAGRLGFWGEPVALIGKRERISYLLGYFQQRRRLGFIPALAVVPDDEAGSFDVGIPVLPLSCLLAKGARLAYHESIQSALVDIENAPEIIRMDTQKVFSDLFHRVILFVDVDWLEGASLRVQDYEGLLGVEARKNELSAASQILKRGMDLVIALLMGLGSLPITLAAALAIRLDGPGSIFYLHERVGRNGERISIYKFRTMLPNAEALLQDYLRANPAAREEWRQTQKLKDDPRITRPGRWLRKWSIDELPQLLNVLKGEMSLVGPRPMLADQVCLYTGIDSYYGVRPGLTGLWQVSGRNHTTFEERSRYDVYYVRNWSVWLDIYILLRTVWVVLSRDGAY